MIVTGFALLAAAAAQDPPQPPVTQRPPLDNDPMRMVCVEERVPGSLLARRRICRTRAEWDDHRRDARNTTEKVQALSRQ